MRCNFLSSSSGPRRVVEQPLGDPINHFRKLHLPPPCLRNFEIQKLFIYRGQITESTLKWDLKKKINPPLLQYSAVQNIFNVFLSCFSEHINNICIYYLFVFHKYKRLSQCVLYTTTTQTYTFQMQRTQAKHTHFIRD